MLRKLFYTEAGWPALALRLSLGVVFFAHGSQKVLGWFGGYGLSGTYHAFVGMGIPPIFAVCAIAAEFLGGIGLLLGLLTRVSAFGIGMVMIVAIATVHKDIGFFMNWFGQLPAGKEGFEYHLLAVGMAAALLIDGGGKLSIDSVIARRLR
ncbi:MAG TPA: DoxX family protein [Nitrospirota bacterium]